MGQFALNLEYVELCMIGIIGLADSEASGLYGINEEQGLVIENFVIEIIGVYGLRDRIEELVEFLAIGQPFSLDFYAPSANTAGGAAFALWGRTEIPSAAMAYDTVIGSFLFAPAPAAGGAAGHFTVFNNLWADPWTPMPSSPAPWSIDAAMGIPVPIRVTLQGMIQDASRPDLPYAVTNGLVLVVQ